MQAVHLGNIFKYFKEILPYLSLTFQYVSLSLIIGLLFATLLTVMKLSQSRILVGIAYAYTTIMRCIPSIVLLFVVYFMLPAFLRDVFLIDINDMPPLFFVIITFSLFLGGFLSEVMRSAYQAVSKDQRDAALSIGLTPLQAFIRIILPQAFYYSIPNLANTVIYLLKEGALAYSIGLIDVMGRAYQINTLSYNQHSLEIFTALTFIYWPLAIIIERLFKLLEDKFNLQKNDKKPSKFGLKALRSQVLAKLPELTKGGAKG
jgi:L-cystine transport system permease protein